MCRPDLAVSGRGVRRLSDFDTHSTDEDANVLWLRPSIPGSGWRSAEQRWHWAGFKGLIRPVGPAPPDMPTGTSRATGRPVGRRPPAWTVQNHRTPWAGTPCRLASATAARGRCLRRRYRREMHRLGAGGILEVVGLARPPYLCDEFAPQGRLPLHSDSRVQTAWAHEGTGHLGERCQHC
jgi:hypothetical protein